jgi:predicted Zn finger-like uncharacterized protein
MSLITRCPACETLFRVVPDQLRMSDGWVRCGQCAEIFDASLHLQPLPIVEPPPQVETALEEEEEEEEEEGTLFDSVQFHERELAEATALERMVPEAPADLSPIPLLPDAGQELPNFEPDDASEDALDSVADVDSLLLQTMPPETLASVSFMLGDGPPSVWRKTWVRVALAGACLVLVTGLALQFIVYERDRIAAMVPGARPALLALCGVLGCEVSPLRQIESMVIESSSFTKIRNDVYRLNFTVKNSAALELEVPALELTLTDSQDQATLRRVILPAELGRGSKPLAPGSEWAGSLTIGVGANASPDRITGYRLLVFYP